MKLTEIIALTKAGYKKADIDAIIAEEGKEAETPEKPEVLKAEPNEEDVPEEPEAPEEAPEDNALIELQKKIAEQDKLIAELQKANNTKTLGTGPDAEAEKKELDSIIDSLLF